ncbi:MAG: shikimate dehydrogenase family protein [Tropicimonas sp.]|uniref:shikimate dehydrogenase family protein n=1 Tax=Tropicimonas sp. TaxID=2067044 RepID=UPI003A88EF39
MSPLPITGTTRFIAMLGDPVVQVKSPMAFADWAGRTGTDAVMLPVQVPPRTLATTLEAMRGWGNCLGAVITFPHKQAAAGLVDSQSEAADLVGACNVIRRSADGHLHGAMTDGAGFVAALRAGGHDLTGIDARLIGAGGAGSAIALALIEAGIRRLVVTDIDAGRRDNLIDRLNAGHKAAISAEAPDGFDCRLACNATPVGMNGDPAHPFPLEQLSQGCVIADIVPSPAETPWILAARARGHAVQTGPAMISGQMPAIISLLLPDKRIES